MSVLVSGEAERYRSGQTGQTVNLLDHSFGGSNPPLSTTESEEQKVAQTKIRRIEVGAVRDGGCERAGIAQLARARAFQARGRGFESRFPLHSPSESSAGVRAGMRPRSSGGRARPW